MKLFNLKNVILKETREEVIKSNPTINEGIVDKIISAVIDRIVKTKYKKYFDELHNDPEYKEAKQRLSQAADNIKRAAESYEKVSHSRNQAYDEYAKKYGKKAADKIIANLHSSKFKF